MKLSSAGWKEWKILSYQSGGYSLKEVGGYFKLHYSTVSGIVS